MYVTIYSSSFFSSFSGASKPLLSPVSGLFRRFAPPPHSGRFGCCYGSNLATKTSFQAPLERLEILLLKISLIFSYLYYIQKYQKLQTIFEYFSFFLCFCAEHSKLYSHINDIAYYKTIAKLFMLNGSMWVEPLTKKIQTYKK